MRTTSLSILYGRYTAIMVLLFSLLALIAKQRVATLKDSFMIGQTTFGFTAAGTYEIAVHGSSHMPLRFGLMSETETKTDSDPCNIAVRLAAIETVFNGSEAALSGSVPAAGVFSVFYASCGSSDENEVTYSYDFANGDSRLDSREMPTLIEAPIALGVKITILAGWIVNWIIHRKTRIYVHSVLTAMFVLAPIASLTRYFVLRDKEKNDFVTSAYAAEVTMKLLFEISLYFTIIMCANGWCIIRRSIRIMEIVRGMVWTVLYLTLHTILDNTDFGKWNVLVMILMCVALALYGRELVVSINFGSLQLYAHCLVISEAGIDPETTPMWEKSRMFERLQWIIVAYLSAILIQVIAAAFLADILWIDPMMRDIADIVILVALAIVYRLQSDNKDGYSHLDDMDMSAALMDIEGAPTGQTLKKGGRKWEEGMQLSRTVDSISSVTLESPEGVTSIMVKREDTA